MRNETYQVDRRGANEYPTRQAVSEVGFERFPQQPTPIYFLYRFVPTVVWNKQRPGLLPLIVANHHSYFSAC